MIKSYVSLVLSGIAIATLSAINVSFATAQGYPAVYPYGVAPPQYPNTNSDPRIAFRPQMPATVMAPPEGQICSPGYAFSDNGWSQAPVAEYCQPPSCNTAAPECCTTSAETKQRRYIADVELLALRTHFSEDPLGKLAEHYELSERFTLGVEKPNGIGGRIRYWTYDRTTPNLSGGSDLGADFSVTDFEGTTNFTTQSFDLTLAGGIRFADIRLDTDAGHVRSNRMPGATFAIDLRGLICGNEMQGLEWHSVSGVRLSILGCDWRSDNGLIADTHDDNVTAMEIYGGFECVRCYRAHEVYARLVFEAQNWRSDALGENTGIDSIGFVGPGLTLGVNS